MAEGPSRFWAEARAATSNRENLVDAVDMNPCSSRSRSTDIPSTKDFIE